MMSSLRKKQIKVTNLQKTGLVGQTTRFDIDASEAGKGCIEIVINDGSTKCIVVKAQGHRQYHASFVPQEAMPYVIELMFNGQPVPESPFFINICDSVVTVTGPGLQRVPVNKPTSFMVCTGNRTKKVVSATIKTPSGGHIEHYILDKDDGTYMVEYTPRQAGTYSIDVCCEGGVVSGNPFSSEVYDIDAVVVSSVSSYIAGKTVDFEIDISKAGDGELEVTILGEENGYSHVIPSRTALLQKGLFLVTFTPPSSKLISASILFNSQKLPQSPFLLNDDPRAESGSRTHQPSPGNPTTSGSNPEGPMRHRRLDQLTHRESPHRLRDPSPDYSFTSGSSIDDSTIRDDLYADYTEWIDCDIPGSVESPSDEEDDHAQRLPGIGDDVAAAFEALQACLEDIQCVHVVRQGLVADLLELYKDQNVASKTLDVTFEGESGVDCNGLTRDLLTSFWRDVLKDLFRGEDCSVPYLPLYRARNESWKFECLGRILSHNVALTCTIPPTLTRSTLIKLITDSEIDDECLMEDFLLFVTTREKALLIKAMTDFSSLTEDESDRLQNFYTAHGLQKNPKGSEIRDQVLTIAHHELVEKPAPLITKMRQGIPENHRAAFWERLSVDDITNIMQAQRPTPEKVVSVITTDEEYMTDDEDRTLYFLKEFVASLDAETLTDFLIFVTGSVHQPDKINVTFTTLKGLSRRPITHTCSNHLEIPMTYDNIQEFTREFKSVLSSPEAFQFSEI